MPGTYDNCKCHCHESQEADGGTNDDAACAEYVGIECVGIVARAQHKDEADYNHKAGTSHRDEIAAS